MNPKLLKVPLSVFNSFSVRSDSVPYFYKELHFHPEIELVHIQKGQGTQIIGPNIQTFKPNDLIMVGADLPHLWKCNDIYFENKSKLKAEATVIHFLPEVFGKEFFKLPENKAILKLITKSKLGLKITNKTKEVVSKYMSQIILSDGTDRIIILLKILNTLAHSKDIVKLNKKEISLIHTEKETDRLNSVFQHLLKNYHNEISLTEIANIANLSPNSFCRYFKLRTNKTYTSFLVELRINHACKLLQETNLAVSNICLESGFNNFSNFNKYFKQKMGMTPLQYRNKLIEVSS